MFSVITIIMILLVSSCTRSLATSGSGHDISELVSDSLSEDTTPTVLHVLAVLPIATNGSDGDGGDKSVFQWKRGEEILPGATLALKEIRKSDYLLNGYQLEVIPVKIPSCSFIKGLVPFIRELTSSQNNIIGIVGYFCQNLQQRFSYSIQHDSIGILQLSAIAVREEYCSSCPQHSILPSAEFSARAVVKLMQKLEWSRIAIISNKDLLNTKQVFRDCAKKEGIDVALELAAPLVTSERATQLLHELLVFATNIIVAFVSSSEAVKIMCSAQRDNFKWPDYAWIFMEIDIDEIAMLPKGCSQHTKSSIMTNSIFVRTMPWIRTNGMEILPSGLNYSAYYNAYLEELEKSVKELNVSLQNNPYASVLYDSIWTIALVMNRSLGILNERNLSFANLGHTKLNSDIGSILEEQLSELSFQGATGYLNFSQGAATVVTSVELFQHQNGQLELIGVYNVSLDKLDLDLSRLGEIPRTMLARSYVLFPVYLTVILTVMGVICFALTAASMCIFFYYRNQPAIKASSSTLSICLFIGCYFHLTSSLFHTINSGISKHESGETLRGFTCSFDVFLFNLGFDIVFATVIAKTLRIYYIFKPFRRMGRICSDQGLFTLILTIVGFKLMLLTLWTSIDIYHLIDIEQFTATSVPPYLIVVQQCHSRYFELWAALHVGYSLVLLLIMVVLAILTRKIKRDHFNNTKKINTLTAVLLFHVCISLSLWFVLRLIGETILSKVMFALSTMFTAVFCQAFLIAPKIVPLVFNRIKYGKPVPQHQFSTMSLSFLSTQTTRVDDASKSSAYYLHGSK